MVDATIYFDPPELVKVFVHFEKLSSQRDHDTRTAPLCLPALQGNTTVIISSLAC